MSPFVLKCLVTLNSLYIVSAISNDICGLNNGKRFYLEYLDSGSLTASQEYQVLDQHSRNGTSYVRCTIEFITCPSCIIEIKFRYLNISRNCGKASVYDTCGCDYVWIYEPPVEDASGEQFCGRFMKSNSSELSYISQSRTVAFAFIYSNANYGRAFALDYYSRRNRINVVGHPRYTNMNNASQYITSPFFPYLYPIDLSVEYVISCESSEYCRISLLFTDFLVDESSIIEFFDTNGQRMYVISGNIFRPPAILSSGPSLIIRFYANGASDFGFKASYAFILGAVDELAFKPNMGCGGGVNNLGGAITMMQMVDDGTKMFDCVWIIKPLETFLHWKTHLYLKVNSFFDFAGTTELTIRQGVTSTQPTIEVLRHPKQHYSSSTEVEHVVPISQGFYISFRGVFTPESRLEIVYAAFSYKDCHGGLDYLCHNLRCISMFLNCDGFDHCGDNSDEPANCSQDPRTHREFSKIPNFFFPKVDSYSDITTATFVFLTCSFGLIGIISAMALLLYRVSSRARHQRQIQDHIETIHAILEGGVRDLDEEIILPDEPPVYEPPPEYNELIKEAKYLEEFEKLKTEKVRCSRCNLLKTKNSDTDTQAECKTTDQTHDHELLASTSRSCQTTPMGIPESPPPSYDKISFFTLDFAETETSFASIIPDESPSTTSQPSTSKETESTSLTEEIYNISTCLENQQKNSTHILTEFKKGFRLVNVLKHHRGRRNSSEENLVRYFSDSHLILTHSLTRIHRSRSNKMNLKKSFSTEDLTSLCPEISFKTADGRY